MAFVDFDGARALAAAEQYVADQPLGEEFLKIYCERVLTAIERLCAWVGEQ